MNNNIIVILILIIVIVLIRLVRMNILICNEGVSLGWWV